MKIKLTLFLCIIYGLLVSSALADNLFKYVRNQEFIGARPMAMGETFVAVADDINTIYWNPAGLPSLNHLGLNSMHANLFNSGIGNNYLALSVPGLPKTSIGVDWMNISFDDPELGFSKNKFNFSAGFQFFKWLSLGMNVKYLRMNAALKDVLHETFQGWGADCGLLVKLTPRLKLGLVVYDFTDTNLEGLQGPVYRQNIRFGAAYHLFDRILIAGDWDDQFHFGSEWQIYKNLLALRLGIQKELYTDENPTLSFGAGLNIPILGQRIRFDYAYTDTPTLPNTHRTSLSFLIDLFPRLVKIREIKIKPAFAALYNYYSDSPIGEVIIENKGDKELDYTLSVAIENYAGEFKKDYVLPPKSTVRIPVQAAFSDTILRERSTIRLQADLTVSYSSGKRPKQARKTESFKLFGRNSIDWELGVEQAAAFVTHQDPVVEDFANTATLESVQGLKRFSQSKYFTDSFYIFNALNRHKIYYAEDPYSPYSKTYQGIDNINYPTQTLIQKRGDCDDLTVLMAALLESQHISTALVSVPGHIFLAFNTGLHARRSFQLCCADEEYYVHHDQIWIPFETTWINHSFCEAWQSGAEAFYEYDAEQRRIVYVRDAWDVYKPIASTAKFINPIQHFTRGHYANEEQQLQNSKKTYLRGLEKKLTQFPDSVKLRNKLAITYAFQGQLDRAEKHFQIILNNDSTGFFANNNLANIFMLRGNLSTAQTYYERAARYAGTTDSTQQDGVEINLGLLFAADGIDSLAEQHFGKAMRDVNGYQRIAQLMGMNITPEELRKADSYKPKKKICKKRVKKIISKAHKKLKKKKPPRKKKFKKIRAKGILPKTEIDNVFYWAY